MTNFITVMIVACCGTGAIFMQWYFLFRNRIADLESDNARLRRLEQVRKDHAKALQDLLTTYQTEPRSLKMAVVLMENTPGSLDVAMRSIGITLPGEAAKKREKAS